MLYTHEQEKDDSNAEEPKVPENKPVAMPDRNQTQLSPILVTGKEAEEEKGEDAETEQNILEGLDDATKLCFQVTVKVTFKKMEDSGGWEGGDLEAHLCLPFKLCIA